MKEVTGPSLPTEVTIQISVKLDGLSAKQLKNLFSYFEENENCMKEIAKVSGVFFGNMSPQQLYNLMKKYKKSEIVKETVKAYSR